MDLEELNRKLHQNERSTEQRAKNKEVQQFRRDARKEGRTVSSTQARLELRLKQVQQNELNKAVAEALQNAVPKAANDPNGFLGRPQQVQELVPPTQTPYVVTPPQQEAQPQVAPPNTITYNAGTDDDGEGILKEGQLTDAKRLAADPDGGLKVESDDTKISFSEKPPDDPEAGVTYFRTYKDGVFGWKDSDMCDEDEE